MSESSIGIADAPASQGDFNLRARIDALQAGDCTEAEFMREVLPLRDSVWAIIAMVDQRYRRGLLREEVFRSVKSKLSRRAVEQSECDKTVELNPSTAAAPAAEIPPTPLGVVTAETPASESHVPNVEGAQIVPAQEAPPMEVQSCAPCPPIDTSSPSVAHKTKLLRDRYALEGLLGRGGMGAVYRASDRHRADLPQKSRHVALKILNASTLARPGAVADLRREFYCAQALAHPNIVKVFELYCEEEPTFYTMELLEGQLLSAVIERHRPQPLDRAQAFAIIRDVGAALVHAHSRDVVHGDLKPHNIMITDADEVRILDFGASGTATRQWVTADALQRNRAPAVTLAYTCCELLDGQQTDPRDDLYALACLSYEMLAGRHPFERLRSTEARDIGMRPARPSGLTNQQWQALELGLSWRRETRSVSVRAWLEMFLLEPAPLRLSTLFAPAVIAARSWRPRGVAAAALVATLLAALSAWTVFYAKHEAKGVGTALVAANPPHSGAAPIVDNPLQLANIGESLAPIGMELDGKLALQPAEPTPYATHEQPAVEAATHAVKLRDAGTPIASQITLSTDTYRVPSGEAFAEITVRRSSDSRGSGSFAWWTEAASARPERDFVAQERTRHIFLDGRHLAKLYIRIVPNPTRVRTETFYIKIGEPGTGYSLGAVTRAAILIPPLLTARNAGTLDIAPQPQR